LFSIRLEKSGIGTEIAGRLQQSQIVLFGGTPKARLNRDPDIPFRGAGA
jgi:hypothetical protein